MAIGGCGNSQTTPKAALKCTGSPERMLSQSQAILRTVAGVKDPDNLKLSEQQEAEDGGIDQRIILTNTSFTLPRAESPTTLALQPQLLGGRLASLTDTLSPQASSLSTSSATCMTQTQALQPACMSLSIPISERTVPQPLHDCALTAPLQTAPPPVFLSATSHGTNFLPGVVHQGIVPHVLANELMAIRARSAWG